MSILQSTGYSIIDSRATHNILQPVVYDDMDISPHRMQENKVDESLRKIQFGFRALVSATVITFAFRRQQECRENGRE